MLIGTHTSDSDQNYLQIATVRMPRADTPLKEENYDQDRAEIGNYDDSAPRVQIIQSINHDGEVNRARYMPQNPDLLATKTVMGEVYIFDRTKHALQPREKDDKCNPNITLRGHTKEGCVDRETDSKSAPHSARAGTACRGTRRRRNRATS
jgi:histone-binding protein RBBP4